MIVNLSDAAMEAVKKCEHNTLDFKDDGSIWACGEMNSWYCIYDTMQHLIDEALGLFSDLQLYVPDTMHDRVKDWVEAARNKTL